MQIDMIRHRRWSPSAYTRGYMAFADASRLADEWCIKTWWGDETLRYSPLVDTPPWAAVYEARRSYFGADGGTRYCVPARYVDEHAVAIALPASWYVEGATGVFAGANGPQDVYLQSAGTRIEYRGDWGVFRPYLRYNFALPNRWGALIFWSSAHRVHYAGPFGAADCEGTYLPDVTVGAGDGGTMHVKWSHTKNWW